MKVLHLNDRLSALGGADRHLVAMLTDLQGRAETLLAVGRDDGSLPPLERNRLGPWLRLKGLDRGGLSPRGGPAALRRLNDIIRSFRPDVIHLHNIVDPILLETAAATGRAVMTVQDHRSFCPGLGHLLPGGGECRRLAGDECLGCFRDREHGRRLIGLTRRRQAAVARMSRVTVLSRYMARQLAAAGVERARLRVLPPFPQGLDGASPGAPDAPGAYHLLACRLVERKGVRVALAAAGLLREPAHLVVAGSGPLAGEVEEAARASGGRIRFAGWAGRPEMARLLRGAVSLWLPSLWAEPFGIVGLESLYLGRPVAAARVGGVEDWLDDGISGFLLPPGDAPALARAADSLAADPERALAMGRAGHRLARDRFPREPLMEKLLAVYREAEQRAGGGAGKGPWEESC